MLGKGGVHADTAFTDGFVGVDYGMPKITGAIPENRPDFNQKWVSEYLKVHPDKSKIAAGLACGVLYTIAKGLRVGDVVLAPSGNGVYRVGEITGEYTYEVNTILPHRRSVRWYAEIRRSDMSTDLRHSAGSIGTVSDVSQYGEEIETLLSGVAPSALTQSGEDFDTASFALEKQLEDFLVENWKSTELGGAYDIYEEDGELIGQQYQSDTGPMDILAISKDKKTLLVVELKRGRASDAVVGQIQRYMGYVKDMLAEDDQGVRGVIIALEDDVRIKRALSVTQNIEFYTYKVKFTLHKQ